MKEPVRKNEKRINPRTTNVDEKRRRFKVVASRRVQKVLDGLGNLEKCSNRRNYEYSEEDVKKMFKVLNDQFNKMKTAFSTGVNKGNRTFEF